VTAHKSQCTARLQRRPFRAIALCWVLTQYHDTQQGLGVLVPSASPLGLLTEHTNANAWAHQYESSCSQRHCARTHLLLHYHSQHIPSTQHSHGEPDNRKQKAAALNQVHTGAHR
jgi:hypothetical protein